MTIAKKDNLYNLIKSLTKNEKKYLRDFLKNQKENRTYLQLFNKLDSLSKNQKSELKATFDNKAKQLPVIKNYLVKQIQKILNVYYRESSSFDIIQNNFIEIHHLLEKELFDLAEFQISRVITLARKDQFTHQLLQALEFQKQFLIKKFGATSNSIKKEIIEIIEEQDTLLGQIYNLHEFQALQATFYDQFHQSSGLNTVIYTNLTKNPLITDEKQAQTLPAKLIQADLNFRLHVYKDKNYPEASQALQKAIHQLERSPATIQQNPEQYFGLLNQQLQLLLQTKNTTELAQTLYLIRSAPNTYNIDTKKPFLRRYIMEAYALELSLYRQIGQEVLDVPLYIGARGQNQKAEQLIALIESEYHDLNSPSLRQWRAVMDYEIARFYLDTDQPGASLRKAKNILKAEYSQREAEIQLRSLLLIVQISLKQRNYLLLKQTLTRLKIFYKNERKPGHLENHLLHFLEIYPSHIQSTRRHAHLQSLLEKIKTSANKKTPPELAELLLWLNQHVESTISQKSET